MKGLIAKTFPLRAVWRCWIAVASSQQMPAISPSSGATWMESVWWPGLAAQGTQHAKQIMWPSPLTGHVTDLQPWPTQTSRVPNWSGFFAYFCIWHWCASPTMNSVKAAPTGCSGPVYCFGGRTFGRGYAVTWRQRCCSPLESTTPWDPSFSAWYTACLWKKSFTTYLWKL